MALERSGKSDATERTSYPTAPSADIVFLLEGTYPFVRGGVSSWVHQIIQGFPEYRFAVVFLGSESKAYPEVRYELPSNLVHLETHFLFEASANPADNKRVPIGEETVKDLHAMYQSFVRTGQCPGDTLAKVANHLLSGKVSSTDFQDSPQAWDLMTRLYQEHGGETSFLDYFWTLKSMHAPIWKLVHVAKSLLPARCYHSASTGYAGLLATLLSLVHKKPFLLSEHGLYTKERKIELMQSSWIRETGKGLGEETAEGGVLRRLWIRFFDALGRSAYATANPILSLYEGIQKQQEKEGASPDRTLCIPNGIPIARFKPLQGKARLPEKPVFTLLGRVVPIKDIKTFIRAMSEIRRTVPSAEGWIVGPMEEDPDYAEECKALVDSLDLDQAVRFLGFQSVDDILAKTSILVLSSISEGLPLTVLEAFAAGVPVVATDVGSCRQLVLGQSGNHEDMDIGSAGRIVDIYNPGALAQAITELHLDANEWQRASVSAIRRVERFYTDERMFASYRNLYQRALG